MASRAFDIIHGPVIREEEEEKKKVAGHAPTGWATVENESVEQSRIRGRETRNSRSCVSDQLFDTMEDVQSSSLILFSVPFVCCSTWAHNTNQWHCELLLHGSSSPLDGGASTSNNRGLFLPRYDRTAIQCSSDARPSGMRCNDSAQLG